MIFFWQVDIMIWKVNINNWQVDIKIWEVNVIMWQVMAELCRHTKQSQSKKWSYKWLLRKITVIHCFIITHQPIYILSITLMKYSKINWNQLILISFSIENQIYQLVFKFYERETENERETERDRDRERQRHWDYFMHLFLQ